MPISSASCNFMCQRKWVYAFNIGLFETCKDNVSAVSPDGMLVVPFDPKTSCESVSNDLAKLRKFVHDGQMPFTARKNA